MREEDNRELEYREYANDRDLVGISYTIMDEFRNMFKSKDKVKTKDLVKVKKKATFKK